LLRAQGFDQPTPLRLFFCSLRCLCALDTLRIIHAEQRDQPLYPTLLPQWTDQDSARVVARQQLATAARHLAEAGGIFRRRPTRSSLPVEHARVADLETVG
jgi:hypothetical protein